MHFLREPCTAAGYEERGDNVRPVTAPPHPGGRSRGYRWDNITLITAGPMPHGSGSHTQGLDQASVTPVGSGHAAEAHPHPRMDGCEDSGILWRARQWPTP